MPVESVIDDWTPRTEAERRLLEHAPTDGTVDLEDLVGEARQLRGRWLAAVLRGLPGAPRLGAAVLAIFHGCIIDDVDLGFCGTAQAPLPALNLMHCNTGPGEPGVRLQLIGATIGTTTLNACRIDLLMAMNLAVLGDFAVLGSRFGEDGVCSFHGARMQGALTLAGVTLPIEVAVEEAEDATGAGGSGTGAAGVGEAGEPATGAAEPDMTETALVPGAEATALPEADDFQVLGMDRLDQQLASLSLALMQVAAIQLSGLVTHRRILLEGTRVVGKLEAKNCIVRVADGVAIHAPGLVTGLQVDFERSEIDGPVNLEGASIGGNLVLSVSTIGSRHGFDVAVNLTGATIRGSVFLGASTVTGAVQGIDCRIGGTLNLRNGTTIRGGDMALVSELFDQGQDAAANRLINNYRTLAFDRAELGGGVFMEGAELTGPAALTGARIGGRLDATGARLVSEVGGLDVLSLEGASVAEQVILTGARLSGTANLRGARVAGGLALGGAELDARVGDGFRAALVLEGASLGDQLVLTSARLRGGLDLRRAKLAGGLAMQKAHVHAPSSFALWADQMTAGGDVEMRDAILEGWSNMVRARLSGALGANGTTWRYGHAGRPVDDRVVLTAEEAEIGGSAYFGDAVFEGSVNFATIRVGGDLYLDGAGFSGTADLALGLSNARIGRTLSMQGLRATENVFLQEADVGANVEMRGAHITVPPERSWAVNADSLRCGGSLGLDETVLAGGFRMLRAQLGSYLSSINALISRPDGVALDCGGSSFGGGLFLSPSPTDETHAARYAAGPGTRFHGRVQFGGAKVAQVCRLSGIRVVGPAEGTALDFNSATISTDVEAGAWVAHGRSRPLQVEGQMSLRNAEVTGDLKLAGAWLTARGTEAALAGEAMRVSGSVLLGAEWPVAAPAPPALRAIGNLHLDRAQIGGALVLDGADLRPAIGATAGDQEEVLSLNLAHIGRRLRVHGLHRESHGAVDLRGAFTPLLDDKGGQGWGDGSGADCGPGVPAREMPGAPLRGVLLRLDGFTYDRLQDSVNADGTPAPAGAAWWEQREFFLRRQFANRQPERQDYNPQPWEQVSRVLRVQGHAEWADHFARGKRDFAIDCRADRAGRRLLSWLAGVCFGHFYSAPRAAVSVLGWMALGAALLVLADAAGQLSRKRNDVDLTEQSLGVIMPFPTYPAAGVPAQSRPPAVLPEAPACWKQRGAGAAVEAALMALDMMLPVVDLKQDTRCEVSDQASRQWLWLLLEAVYTIIGWLVSSLAVITFSGVAKKE